MNYFCVKPSTRYAVRRKLLPLRIIQVGYTVSAKELHVSGAQNSLAFKIKDGIYRKSSFSGTERAFSTIAKPLPLFLYILVYERASL